MAEGVKVEAGEAVGFLAVIIMNSYYSILRLRIYEAIKRENGGKVNIITLD